MPNSRLYLLLAFVCLTLAGCASNDKKTLPGARVAVLQFQDTVTNDEKAKDIAINLAPESTNAIWPQVLENPAHSPLNVSLSAGTLKKIWSADIGAGSKRDRKLITAPVAIGNAVYATDTDGDVSAYNLGTGKNLWHNNVLPKDAGNGTVSPGLAADGDRIYVTDGFTNVVALDPATGKRPWTHSVDQPLRGSPSVDDKRLFVVTLNNETVCLDKTNGEVIWRHEGVQEAAGLLGAPSPAVEDSVVITTYSSGDVAALRTETGSEAWTDNLNGANDSENRAMTQLAAFRAHPVLEQGIAYVGNLSSRFVAIQISSGERIWQKEFGLMSTPWVSGNMIFVITSQDALVALVKETGQVRWSVDLPHYEDPEDRKDTIFWQGPLLAGGQLLVVGSNGRMLELNPQNGKITKDSKLGGKVMVAPAIAQKTLLIVTDNGDMAAYK